MKRWLVAARLVAVGLVLGLAGGAEAQPVSGGLLGRGASYSGFVAPSGCVSSSVPFFGADLKLTCDGGLTYDAATDTLSVGALNINGKALTSPGTGVLQLGAANAASPVAQTLQAQGSRGGTDTNVAGANLTIRPGAGTGTATGSSLIFQTPTATGSGSTAQTQTTRLELSPNFAIFWQDAVTLGGDTYNIGTSTRTWRSGYFTRATLGSKAKAIVDGSATAFATFTIADAASYSGKLIYNVRAVKGTAIQNLFGEVGFSATREGSTYTAVVGTTAETASQVLAAAAGTLTGGVTIACTAGVCTLSATFDTSQSSPDSFAINYRFNSTDAALVITPL